MLDLLTINIKRSIRKMLLWRVKNISERNFVFILSFAVGVGSGLAAVVLKNAIHLVQNFVLNFLHYDNKENYFYLLFPMMGILVTILFVRYLIQDSLGHGVTKILHSISQSSGYLKAHNMFSSVIASSFTIGFGGSVGAEGPIVLTGSAIGSNIGRFFRVNYRTIKLLIGCGAAGAIAGIFKAPIAGLAFTLEVLMLDLTMASIVPLLISAVTAASVAYFFLGKEVEFSFVQNFPFNMHNIPYYILLGLVCGFVSLYFTRMLMYVEGRFVVIKNVWTKWIVGGAVLSVLIFLFPSLYGEGYHTIIGLLEGSSSAVVDNSLFFEYQSNPYTILAVLFCLMLFKVIATATTTGSGGVGGTFAPSLFLGGVTGYFIAFLINLSGFVVLPLPNFTLVGMAGIMSAVMHAPLTAIFLIAEITGGYGLFIPLMITSTIAYITIKYFEPHSIYAKRLALKGQLITHHKDRAILTLLKLDNVIETDFAQISPVATLGELVTVIASAKRNVFPVVNDRGELDGIVLLDDVRSIMFDVESYDKVLVHQLASMPPAVINSSDSMDIVMKKFEDTEVWNLPVVQENIYIGFVSKSKILTVYRDVLIDFSGD